MKHFLSKLCILTVLLAVLATPLMAGTEKQDQQEAGIYGSLETFANILDLIKKHYVDEVSSKELLTGAVNGMLGVLDPHSSYLSPKEFKELHEDSSGSFSGIGIEVTVKDGMLTVISPIAGTPAFKQGIKAGDQILGINGHPTKDMSISEAIALLRGDRGEKVTLSVGRQGQEEVREIILVRELIPQHSIIAIELAPGLHQIQITNFQVDTARDFIEALKQAGKKQPINGLIMDMRNNPGGLLDQAVKVADMFIDQGTLVSTMGRDKEDNILFEARPGTENYAFPIVVLVNSGSASAAEIVAGALQDYKRAVILGTRTFGKGSVQTVVPLPNGAGLRLTTARYYTPSGRSIQETGIIPDMVVPFEEEARDDRPIREKDLRHHFENKGLQGKEKKQPDSKQQEIEERLAADNQLRTALFILQNLR